MKSADPDVHVCDALERSPIDNLDIDETGIGVWGEQFPSIPLFPTSSYVLDSVFGVADWSWNGKEGREKAREREGGRNGEREQQSEERWIDKLQREGEKRER